MTVALSSKGQVVLPKQARARLQLRPGAKFACRIDGDSITELGFVGVSALTGLQPDIATAKQALDALESSSKIRFELIPDDVGAATLPRFVKKPQAIADGHLWALARKNSMRLVTFDQGIPDAVFIA